jgi:hypothetical protein
MAQLIRTVTADYRFQSLSPAGERTGRRPGEGGRRTGLTRDYAEVSGPNTSSAKPTLPNGALTCTP